MKKEKQSEAPVQKQKQPKASKAKAPAAQEAPKATTVSP